ncbi:hypothetical protein BU23DRAFT_628969 [Bimuria novae-zelandiae CBS 107.79]|uniref:Uncharacterized protein n=1 Tax=Bimuria novae-zelandiae CBS 107.79 TaxID=1447943 RepID=A0A6A5UVT0_9PLEO|nr:hypothetical protein BU23DRAFT_628969 [Bimuria novae-zelandiae CBS 107.79]
MYRWGERRTPSFEPSELASYIYEDGDEDEEESERGSEYKRACESEYRRECENEYKRERGSEYKRLCKSDYERNYESDYERTMRPIMRAYKIARNRANMKTRMWYRSPQVSPVATVRIRMRPGKAGIHLSS